MKISIIGGGPAGLYFATALKKRVPSASVTVFEKSEHPNGVGYVVEQAITKELNELEPNIVDAIGCNPEATWSTVEIEAKLRKETQNFATSVGIRRSRLIDLLKQLALEHHVQLKYSPITSKDVEQLRKSSDVLIAADGLHSIVRQQYRSEMGAVIVHGRNSYAWLEGHKKSDRMRVTIAEAYGAVFVATTYPIDRSTEAVILETPAQRPTANPKELSEAFNGFIRIDLKQNAVRWAKTVLNGCDRLSFDNVALIGESGFSSHYHIGAGLLLAFRAARTLADCIADNPKAGLEAYQRQTFPWAKKIHEASIPGMRWLEGIKDYCQELGPDELIYAFRMKGRL